MRNRIGPHAKQWLGPVGRAYPSCALTYRSMFGTKALDWASTKSQMKATRRPTSASARADRTTPMAARVSGHKSSTHSSTGASLSLRRRMAGRQHVMGDGWRRRLHSSAARAGGTFPPETRPARKPNSPAPSCSTASPTAEDRDTNDGGARGGEPPRAPTRARPFPRGVRRPVRTVTSCPRRPSSATRSSTW